MSSRALAVAVQMITCLCLGSCTASGVGRNWGYTPAGAFDVASCGGACVEKLNVGTDGERCIRFTRSMADICLKDSGKVQPRGTFVLTKDPG